MATAAVEEEEMQYAAYEEEEDGVEERWQCRLCFASLYGSERIEAHGALAPPSLREALNLSSGLSAVAGALPLLCRREFMSTSGLEAAAPAAAPAPAPALAAVPAAAMGVAEGGAAGLRWNTPLLQLLRETLEGKTALIALAAPRPPRFTPASPSRRYDS